MSNIFSEEEGAEKGPLSIGVEKEAEVTRAFFSGSWVTERDEVVMVGDVEAAALDLGLVDCFLLQVEVWVLKWSALKNNLKHVGHVFLLAPVWIRLCRDKQS